MPTCCHGRAAGGIDWPFHLRQRRVGNFVAWLRHHQPSFCLHVTSLTQHVAAACDRQGQLLVRCDLPPRRKLGRWLPFHRHFRSISRVAFCKLSPRICCVGCFDCGGAKAPSREGVVFLSAAVLLRLDVAPKERFRLEGHSPFPRQHELYRYRGTSVVHDAPWSPCCVPCVPTFAFLLGCALTSGSRRSPSLHIARSTTCRRRYFRRLAASSRWSMPTRR